MWLLSDIATLPEVNGLNKNIPVNIFISCRQYLRKGILPQLALDLR